MSVTNFTELSHHIGHQIVCVYYGEMNKDGEQPFIDEMANVALECETCNTILLDFDNERTDEAIEPCIKAGSSEKGVCPECGKAWERVTVKSNPKGRKTTEWQPTCLHGTEHKIPKEELDADPSLLYDFEIRAYDPIPAHEWIEDCGRNGAGVELNRDYIELAKKRIGGLT